MTLTETAQFTKRGLRIALVLGFALIILWIVVNFLYKNVYKPIVDAPKADTKFGVLPAPLFPKTKVSPTDLTYTIDTSTGNLPGGDPKILPAFFIPQQISSLESPDRVRKIALNFKFKNPPDILSPTVYKFHDDAGGELTIDLTTENFTLRRPTPTNIDPNSGGLPPESSMADLFRNYLSSKDLIKDELQNGDIKVTYDQGTNTNSSTATVTMWQNALIKIPIVSDDIKSGLIKAVVSSSGGGDDKFIQLDYTYWPIDQSIFGTYQIKTDVEAFEQLKNGGGTVVIAPPDNHASISKVYLAYFLPSTYVQYVQPIYVFEGQNFDAYVPAIVDGQVQK